MTVTEDGDATRTVTVTDAGVLEADRRCPVCDNAPMVRRHLHKSRPHVQYDTYTWVCEGCGAVRSDAPWKFRGHRLCRTCERVVIPERGVIGTYLRCPDCTDILGRILER